MRYYLTIGQGLHRGRGFSALPDVLAEAMKERTNTTRKAAFFMGMVLSNVVKSILW
jgi:hypothetical protein